MLTCIYTYTWYYVYIHIQMSPLTPTLLVLSRAFQSLVCRTGKAKPVLYRGGGVGELHTEEEEDSGQVTMTLHFALSSYRAEAH